MEAHETHEVQRGQKEPPPGARPGILAEPGPLRSDRSLRRSSGTTPLLVVASLAAAAADGVDAATISFLTAQALEDRRKEEKERSGKRRRGVKKALRVPVGPGSGRHPLVQHGDRFTQSRLSRIRISRYTTQVSYTIATDLFAALFFDFLLGFSSVSTCRNRHLSPYVHPN